MSSSRSPAFSQAPVPKPLSRRHLGLPSIVRCSLKLPRPALVFITPNGICDDRRLAVNLAKEAISGGATLVQLRDRLASQASFRDTALAIAAALPSADRLVINGPRGIWLVSEIGANVGIHVREKDILSTLRDNAVREYVQGRVYVGCSVHSVESARLALTALPNWTPSYLQVGTMFATQSHPGKTPEGARLLHDIQKICGNLTSTIGVGGINVHNLSAVMHNDDHDLAHGIAVISAIASSCDPKRETKQLRQALQAAYRPIEKYGN